ncbi:hypothetical protein U9M48_011715 [Paspalum notatum var. saurae]|uniref:CCHC-type domain-containing protein n=1 Tax=Paspalum notatum var. saurae TaxID=547442 RepID=A0AAQ3SXL2_PASNO
MSQPNNGNGGNGDDNAGGSGGTVVQRVIHEVGGGTSYPALTKTNYSDWAALMKVKLKARALWAAVDPGGVEPLDVLASAVPAEMVATVANKETARAAWDAIKTMRVGDERVRKSTAQHLRRQFDLATSREDENVEDYSMRLSGMVAQLATLGVALDQPTVVSKFLRSVPARFKQIVVAIQTLLDVSTLTLEEATGLLKAAKEELEAPPPSVHHNGKMYLTEEAWEAKWKQHEVEKSSADGGSGGSGRRGGKGGHGRGRGGDAGAGSFSSSGPGTGIGKVGRNQCRKCGKTGHWARDCRS